MNKEERYKEIRKEIIEFVEQKVLEEIDVDHIYEFITMIGGDFTAMGKVMALDRGPDVFIDIIIRSTAYEADRVLYIYEEKKKLRKIKEV